MARTIQFQHLLLPFQIVLLVVAGNPCLGDRTPLGCVRVKQLGLEFGEIVATVPRHRTLRDQLPGRLPTPQGVDGHASYLIVSEAYWPYCRAPQPVLLPADAGLQAYVRKVHEMFLRPTCVQAQFTSDDQQLATLW